MGDIKRLAALLISVVVLICGHGLLTLLVPLRGAELGFGPALIGAIGSAYFAGFVAGSLLGVRLIRRVGHVRGFAIAGGLATAIALAMPLLQDPWAWGLLRLGFGGCIAALYTVIESWLNDTASQATRGQTLAVYATLVSLAYGTGQALNGLLPQDGMVPFLVVGILLALAPIAAVLSLAPQPRVPGEIQVRIGQVFAISPVGATGALLIGVATGALWTLAPIYAEAMALSTGWIGVFTGAFVFGGAVGVLPIGKLSDRVDRRAMILALSLIGAGFAALLAVLVILKVAVPPPAMIAAAAVFGAFALPIQAVAVAHTNDKTAAGDFVAVASALLILLGIGSVLGPLLAAPFMTVLGAGGLFVAIALTLVALGLFTAVRMRIAARVPTGDKTGFVPLARTTPVALKIDPRGSDL